MSNIFDEINNIDEALESSREKPGTNMSGQKSRNKKGPLPRSSKVITPRSDAKAQVGLVLYDSMRSDSMDDLENILALIASFPEEYELMSMDKSITPGGAFVCAVLYRHNMPIDATPEEDLEVSIVSDDE